MYACNYDLLLSQNIKYLSYIDQIRIRIQFIDHLLYAGHHLRQLHIILTIILESGFYYLYILEAVKQFT